MPAPSDCAPDPSRGAPGRVVVVMDRPSREFAPPSGPRRHVGFSLFVCLPDGLSTQPSAGTGTVMRTETLRTYARDAGFSDVEVMPTGEFGFWRFYRLVP